MPKQEQINSIGITDDQVDALNKIMKRYSLGLDRRDVINNDLRKEQILEVLALINERDREIFLMHLQKKSIQFISDKFNVSTTTTGKKIEACENAIYYYFFGRRTGDVRLSLINRLNRATIKIGDLKQVREERLNAALSFLGEQANQGNISTELSKILQDYYEIALKFGGTGEKSNNFVPILDEAQYMEFYAFLIDGLTKETYEEYQKFILAVLHLANSDGVMNNTNIKYVVQAAYAKLLFLRSGLQNEVTETPEEG
jgi:hypothetical protein